MRYGRVESQNRQSGEAMAGRPLRCMHVSDVIRATAIFSIMTLRVESYTAECWENNCVLNCSNICRRVCIQTMFTSVILLHFLHLHIVNIL